MNKEGIKEEELLKLKKVLYKLHKEKAKVYGYKRQKQNAEQSYS